MTERRLGASPLAGKPSSDISGTQLRGKLGRYVPRGAQYDYAPPSVFVRYKILTAIFAGLAVALFGYWAIVLRQSHAAIQPPRRTQPAASARPSQPQNDPVYIEPVPPPR